MPEVRHSLTVAAPQERAFAVFTERLGSWWPVEQYGIGARPAVDARLEPRAGGRWYEVDAEGAETPWGRVLAWERPDRVVLSWEISADWRADPAIASEVEVRFTPAADGHTRVELEHRGLEAYADRAAEMGEQVGGDHGWPLLLGRYAEAL